MKISTKLTNLYLEWSRKKREHKNHQYQNGKGVITTDPININKIIREFYIQFYTKKYDNVDEMDIFLGKDNLPKLTEGIENLINPIAIKEI